jgi:hypothetical protein
MRTGRQFRAEVRHRKIGAEGVNQPRH